MVATSAVNEVATVFLFRDRFASSFWFTSIVRSQSLGQIARDSPYGLNQKRQFDNFDHQKILVHHNHPSQSLSAEKQHRNSLLIRSSHWARQMKRLFPRMRTYILRNRSYLALNQSRDLSTICTSEFV